MAFLGELSDIGVADLLYLLALRRQTGKLAISANGDEVSLFLQSGQIVLVTSSNMALRLGRMLNRMGYLTPNRLREALQHQDKSHHGKPLGAILIEREFITEEQLARCVEEQCVEILARVIGADRGIFVFHRDMTAHELTALVPLNSDHILLEASHRADELARLRELLPEPTAPLMLSPEWEEVTGSLTDIEVLVTAALDGRTMSLSEIRSQLDLQELTLWRSVVDLRARGLIVAGHQAAEVGEAVLA